MVFTRNVFLHKKRSFLRKNDIFCEICSFFKNKCWFFDVPDSAAMVKAKVAKVKIIEAVDVAN